MSRNFYVSLEQSLSSLNQNIKKFIKDVDGVTQFTGINLLPHTRNRPEIEVFCALRNIPKSNTKSRRLHSDRKDHIFINGRLTQHEQVDFLKSYGTQISYCASLDSNKPDELTSIMGYHYDVSLDEKSCNHPVFHAQQNSKLFRSIFDEDKRAPYSTYIRNTQCIGLDNPVEIRTIRIPTPQMDAISAIFMVLADYIVKTKNDEHNEKFTELLNKANDIILPVNFEPLTCFNRELMDASLRITNWYPKA